MPILGTIASSRLKAVPEDFAIAHDVSPYVSVWPFSGTTGYGTKYSNPSTLPPSTGHGVDFSGNNETIGITGYQFASAYSWTVGTGFGSRISNTTPALYFTSLSIAKSNAFAAMTTYGSTKGVHGYAYSTSTGFGSKFSDPATLPSPNEEMYNVNINNASTDVAYVGYSPPAILAYPMSGSGFGTKYANPNPTQDNMGGVDFHPTDASIWCSGRYGVYAQVYAWTNGSGFGSKYANPSSALTGWAMDGSFNPNGNVIGFGLQASISPFIEAYAWSNLTGWGTKYSAPSTTPAGQVSHVRFTVNGNAVAGTMNTGAYTIAYAWSDSTGFGSKFSDPATAPTGYPLYANFTR